MGSCTGNTHGMRVVIILLMDNNSNVTLQFILDVRLGQLYSASFTIRLVIMITVTVDMITRKSLMTVTLNGESLELFSYANG